MMRLDPVAPRFFFPFSLRTEVACALSFCGFFAQVAEEMAEATQALCVDAFVRCLGKKFLLLFWVLGWGLLLQLT